MGVSESQNIVLFVSTGRCGTTRLAEILSKNLMSNELTVCHQMNISRISNVLGNLMYFLGGSERIKKILFGKVLKSYVKDGDFISTDPLTSMIIPNDIVQREKTFVVHITRNPDEFADSFYNYTRSRRFSFIAHNFIPFWQPYLWPLENWLLGKKVKSNYKKIGIKKNEWFRKEYSQTGNYHEITMDDLFNTNILLDLITSIFPVSVRIDVEEFKQKSNQSSK